MSDNQKNKKKNKKRINEKIKGIYGGKKCLNLKKKKIKKIIKVIW